MKRTLSLIASIIGIVASVAAIAFSAYAIIILFVAAMSSGAFGKFFAYLFVVDYPFLAMLVGGIVGLIFSIRSIKNRNADTYKMASPIVAAVALFLAGVFGILMYKNWIALVIGIVAIAAGVLFIVDAVLGPKKDTQPQQTQNPEQPQA